MGANEPPILGKSLPVPSVQELAKEKLISVPARYVRLDQDSPTIPDTASASQVPVIDLEKLFPGAGGHDHNEVVDSELEKFHLACKDWGFFQVINHGVSGELIEKMKAEVEAFFKMPIEEKKKLWQKPGDVEGFGQYFVLSEEQKLDWYDVFYCVTLPTHLRKPYLFAELPVSMRNTLEEYSTEVRLLSQRLFGIVAKALKMECEDITQLFEDGWQGTGMNYYPPCPEPELVIGMNSHSDASGITILLQINEMDGLQIKKDGKWLSVKPIPDAFVVNIGDILEIVTNGTYKSIEHRATVNSEKERLSLATFSQPKMDGYFGPAPSLVTPSTPALFKQIGVIDYFKSFFARELNGKSFIDVMKI